VCGTLEKSQGNPEVNAKNLYDSKKESGKASHPGERMVSGNCQDGLLGNYAPRVGLNSPHLVPGSSMREIFLKYIH
jgi:hypothetical protein